MFSLTPRAPTTSRLTTPPCASASRPEAAATAARTASREAARRDEQQPGGGGGTPAGGDAKELGAFAALTSAIGAGARGGVAAKRRERIDDLIVTERKARADSGAARGADEAPVVLHRAGLGAAAERDALTACYMDPAAVATAAGGGGLDGIGGYGRQRGGGNTRGRPTSIGGFGSRAGSSSASIYSGRGGGSAASIYSARDDASSLASAHSGRPGGVPRSAPVGTSVVRGGGDDATARPRTEGVAVRPPMVEGVASLPPLAAVGAEDDASLASFTSRENRDSLGSFGVTFGGRSLDGGSFDGGSVDGLRGVEHGRGESSGHGGGSASLNGGSTAGSSTTRAFRAGAPPDDVYDHVGKGLGHTLACVVSLSVVGCASRRHSRAPVARGRAKPSSRHHAV